jgi:hypothetical protein
MFGRSPAYVGKENRLDSCEKVSHTAGTRRNECGSDSTSDVQNKCLSAPQQRLDRLVILTMSSESRKSKKAA